MIFIIIILSFFQISWISNYDAPIESQIFDSTIPVDETFSDKFLTEESFEEFMSESIDKRIYDSDKSLSDDSLEESTSESIVKRIHESFDGFVSEENPLETISEIILEKNTDEIDEIHQARRSHQGTIKTEIDSYVL